MASKSSIAIRRNGAIDRCLEAIQTIWGEDFELPRRHRDLTMLAALQLEAIADYLEYKAAQAEDKIVMLPSVPLGTPRISTRSMGEFVIIDHAEMAVAQPLAALAVEPAEDAMPASKPKTRKTPKTRKSGKRAYPKQR